MSNVLPFTEAISKCFALIAWIRHEIWTISGVEFLKLEIANNTDVKFNCWLNSFNGPNVLTAIVSPFMYAQVKWKLKWERN